MNTDPKGDENIERSGEAAKEWLRNHVPSINRKWKSVVIQYSEVETREYFREQSGQLREYICPPIYILTYYRSFFRFFGRSEKAVIEFSESDICSITFRRDVSMAIWDAHYYLYILLRHGAIEMLYHPPFYGVTPIANARHSVRYACGWLGFRVVQSNEKSRGLAILCSAARRRKHKPFFLLCMCFECRKDRKNRIPRRLEHEFSSPVLCYHYIHP